MPKRPKNRRPTSQKPRRRSKKTRATRARPKRLARRAVRKRKRILKRTSARRSTAARSRRTAKQYFTLSAHKRDRWKRVLQVISDLRAGKPARQAFLEAGVTRQIAQRLAPTAFRKLRNGRFVLKPTDRLLRMLYLPDETARGGKREVSTRDSRQAAVVSEYWHAVQRYLRTGDSAGLDALSGTSVISANGKAVPLLTDLGALRRLANAGVLAFETIYSK